MNKKQILEDITTYIEPIIQSHQYELVDIELVKEGPTLYLRIYIDKEGGITIQDCEITSRAIEEILDEKDPIENAYILEVSSPGLDRVLKKDKDFEKFKGRMVDVKLYKPLENRKHFTATLVSKQIETLVLKEDENTFEIPLKDIAQVRLAVIL